MVFISPVRTRMTNEPDSEGGQDKDYLGIMSDEGELITAFTRAKSCLFVVGDPVALCRRGKCKNIWMKYIETCKQNESLIFSNEGEADIISRLLSSVTPDRERPAEAAVATDARTANPRFQQSLQSLPNSSFDDEVEFELDGEFVADKISEVMDEENKAERKRQSSTCIAEEAECVVDKQIVEDEQEADNIKGKSRKKRKGRKFRMLEGEERVFLEVFEDVGKDRSKMEGGYAEEAEEEREDMMSDEAQKEDAAQKAKEYPGKYPICLVRFAENNVVYGVPRDAHFADKIFLSSKRMRKRALDGDQAIVEVTSTKNNVTYGEVVWTERYAALKRKKLVCTLDTESIGLMCPIECNTLHYPKMFIFPNGVGQTDEGINFGMYLNQSTE